MIKTSETLYKMHFGSISLFMHDLKTQHMSSLKHIIWYIQGTLEFSLHLYSSSIDKLNTYCYAHWSGCLDTRRFTYGYHVYLGHNFISWSTKRQPTILSRSSAEVEYHPVTNVVYESCWLRNLLLELYLSCFESHTDLL